MKKVHLTPDGIKPCNAVFRKCKYEFHDTHDEGSKLIDSAVKDVQQGKLDAINNFLNNLSDSMKKPRPVLNEVFKKKGGQYAVICPDVSQHDAPLTHIFGDFIKDKGTAEKLHKVDRHKHYQLGWCGLLAEGLLRNNEHVEKYYFFQPETGPQSRTHHFVKLKDGTYADSLGIWTEKALFSKWKINNPTRELSIFDRNSPDLKELNAHIKVDIKQEYILPVINGLINKHMKGETL